MITLTLEQLLVATSKARNILDQKSTKGDGLKDLEVTIILNLDDWRAKTTREAAHNLHLVELRFSYVLSRRNAKTIQLNTPVIVKN